MRKEYDFTAARKNPYAIQLKKQLTIRIDEESISYLRDCATYHCKLDLNWA